MINVAASILIYKPPPQVFDFVSSTANDFEWQYGTLASGQISAGQAAVGASFRTIGHVMGRRMHRTFEITEYETDSRFGFRSLSGPLESHTLYSLRAFQGGTRIEVSTRATPANALPVRERDLARHMQKELKEDLAMLKSLLESGPDQALSRS
ncbi:MAG: SRPBCC family protein [Anaerolineales bacterium]